MQVSPCPWVPDDQGVSNDRVNDGLSVISGVCWMSLLVVSGERSRKSLSSGN
jgi:hypothetical protein